MLMPAHNGLGDAEKVAYTGVATTGASIALGVGVAAHLIPVAAAGPIGAAIAGVGLLLSVLFGRKSGAQKVAATKIVDQAEVYLQQNLEAYRSSSRTSLDREAALANFDYAWQQTVNALSDPNLGSAGARGISERDRGGRWDWYSYYRDPIANDTVSIVGTAFESDVSGLLLPLAAGGLLLWGVLA